ncbi:hypothetical protein SLS62_007630 [Diatrype stigma]|uniref:Uncharacterized protein n=1 Tax=Diatrype stigma TaxID=117547 RepID=A0AAN9YN94_9PEZI
MSRLEVLEAFKKEWTTTEGFRRTIDPGFAQIMKATESPEWLDHQGGTMLLAQSASEQSITIYVPSQELEDELRDLADTDLNAGTVKRIGDILWAFYFPGKDEMFQYFPSNDAAWRVVLQESKVDMSAVANMNEQAWIFFPPDPEE